MDSLSLVFLGVISVASLLQAVALVVIAREGLRAARRLDAFAERVGRELRPAVADLEQAGRDFTELSDLVAVQARRVDALMAEAVERVERATDLLQDVVLPAAGRLLTAAAAFRGLRKGYQLFRRWRG
jgi:hypothetical protein